MIASGSAALPASIEGPASARASAAATSSVDDLAELDPADVEELLDVEPEDVDPEALEAAPESVPSNGFHAFLRHANLHNVLQIESLSRTSGVFLVVSGGSRGYLHLSQGELVHAETGGLSGEAAAVEILSWEDGEFKSCSRTLAPVRTVHSSVQALIMRLASASDQAAQAGRRHASSRVVRRPLDQDAPTQPHLPPATPGERKGGSEVASPAARVPRVEDAPAPATRSSRPPPLPGHSEREPSSVADVVLSASGELLYGRGAANEEFAARVAYASRLAELIGRSIRSGTPRGVELRGKTTQTLVRWEADGNLAASLELLGPTSRR